MKGVVKGSVENASYPKFKFEQRLALSVSAFTIRRIGKCIKTLLNKMVLLQYILQLFTTFIGNQYLPHRAYHYHPHIRMAHLTALCLCSIGTAAFAFMLSR